MSEQFTFEDVAEPDTFSFEEVSNSEPDRFREAIGSPGFPAPRDAMELAAQNFQRRRLPSGAFIPESISGQSPMTFGGTTITPVQEGIGFPSVRPPEDAGTIEKIAAGAYNTIASIPNFMLQPEGVATAMVPAAIPARFAAPLLKGTFMGLMSKATGEAAGKASVTKDAQDITEALGAAAMIPLIARAPEGARPPREPAKNLILDIPSSVTETIPSERTANAIQPESTQLLRSLREEPSQGAREMPAPVSGEQINARGSEATPQQPTGTPEAVPTETPIPVTPELLSKELGVRVAGEGPFGILLETKNAKGEPGTSFIVKPGSTLEQAKAAYEATRKRFEGDPDQPAPLKEAGTEPAKADPVSEKEQTIKKRIESGLAPENVQITVSKDPALPAASYIQVDETHPTEGNVFSSNPETLNKLGFKMPTSQELLKLPAGRYKLPELPKPTATPEPVAAPEKGSNGMPGSIQDVPAPSPPAARGQSGLAKEARARWANATAAEPLGSEAGFINLQPLKDLWESFTPAVQRAADAVKGIAREVSKPGKMDNYRTAVLNWSAKLQRSFGEAAQAQKEIIAAVKDSVRREAITNWIQAGGDPAVLQSRAAASNPKLRPGYEAALTLTPEELTIARDVKATFDDLASRGQHYGILNSFKDNYVPQVWKLAKSFTGGGSRTLKDKFKFAKARTFESFFEGEQAGYIPKTKDISKLLPVYLHEMNSVIAARQLVEQMSKGTASDGRPLVAPRGMGKVVSDPSGTATLITPKAIKGDTLDYRVLPNQPALNDWTWAAKDEAGNNIFLKSDLALHPEAAAKLKNVLGKSAIREWYNSKTTAMAEVPKLLVKGLDFLNNETKRTMLGLIAPFHQVQEGTHALGHRVNPFFNIPEIDLVRNIHQMDAARHGLMMLPDRASEAQFMEGFRPSGLISAIPGLGKVADFYSHYLFHNYIPGLKYKTYEAILDRNRKLYSNEIGTGQVRLADIKHLSAEQANAAFGHLNYADLARNPTIQHIAQLGLLAPDFLEARGRFAGQSLKGATGGKVGREQLLALATLALGQAALAYTTAKLTGGQWDKKHPFEMTHGNKRYTLRSVPEDLQSLLQNTRIFAHGRLSPIIGKGTLQYGTGRDWKGQRVSAADTTKELLQQPIPLSARGFLGIGNSNLSGWEQLLGSVGLKISRSNPKAEKASKLNQRIEMMTPKLRKLPLSQRRSAAIKELKELSLADREKAMTKLARQGVFTYR